MKIRKYTIEYNYPTHTGKRYKHVTYRYKKAEAIQADVRAKGASFVRTTIDVTDQVRFVLAWFMVSYLLVSICTITYLNIKGYGVANATFILCLQLGIAYLYVQARIKQRRKGSDDDAS